MCGQPTVYNTYATLSYTNPQFMGFSRSQNVSFSSQRDNQTEYHKNINPLGNPIFPRGFLCPIVPKMPTCSNADDSSSRFLMPYRS